MVPAGGSAGVRAGEDDPFESLGRRRSASGEAVPVAGRRGETPPAADPFDTGVGAVVEAGAGTGAETEVGAGAGREAGAGAAADAEHGRRSRSGGRSGGGRSSRAPLRSEAASLFEVERPESTDPFEAERSGSGGSFEVERSGPTDPFEEAGRRGRARGAEGGFRRAPGRRRGAARAADPDAEAAARPVDPVKEQRKATDLCYALLTARARTRVELKDALLRKGISDQTAELVLGKFDRAGLIDDAAFAEVWVRSRHTYQGLGRRALARELRRKGVADEVAAEAVAAVDDEAEEERARELVRKKLRTMSGLENQVKIRRLVGALARKGYAEGMAYRVVRDELRDAEAESPLDDHLPD